MADVHGDHSQILDADNPERGRLAKRKASQEKPPSMQQRRKSVARKLMGTQELPETYEEYEAMKNKPQLPSADVKAGGGKVKPVYFKGKEGREQATKDAASLAMRESEQQKKLDKFTSIPDSFGREVSQFVTGDEYFGGELIEGAKDAASNVGSFARRVANKQVAGMPKEFAGEVGPEALTAIAAWALNSVGDKVAERARDRELSGNLKQHGLDVMNLGKGLKGEEESIADANFKKSSKQLKALLKEDRDMLKLIRDPKMSAKSSEHMKNIRNSERYKFHFLKNLQEESYDALRVLAEEGVPQARKKEARKIADRLFKMGQKALGKNAFKAAAALTFPGLGALVSFIDHTTGGFERAKELPNKLAQAARSLRRPLVFKDLEGGSVIDSLRENEQLREDLYSRGVLSAKLYDRLTESDTEESVFEGE